MGVSARAGPSRGSTPLLLLELGVEPSDPVLRGAAERLLAAWRPDGRFRLAPDGAIYPCHTVNAASALCHLDYAADPRLERTFEHLMEIQRSDGGWRSSNFSDGQGTDTDSSDPGPTLTALDAFRSADPTGRTGALDRAVECLLDHWTTRAPRGLCHFGIGTLFMQVEYPFASYDLFVWVHVLSFYASAREDPRFREALASWSRSWSMARSS